MFKLGTNFKEVERNIKKLARKSPAAFEKAMAIAGLTFLDWANNGSSRESRKPPIKWGFLRGSSSVFLGNKLLGAYEQEDNREANRSHSEKPFTLTWGWNAEYATNMHETDYQPGEHSERDGDAGNKWLEKHIRADRDALMEMTAKTVKKELGT